ncbi:hypothetical protein BD410DRAFT_90809 [Rickenella mellea]|uniref:Uncharacterized protein n=1 Tax=Rickenella mellea TaxID=50990 RepID=A0A4Y7QB39_9AGAM|nr:hypothetical protein BD410DRAFT_90809 [Rickenella mellea]
MSLLAQSPTSTALESSTSPTPTMGSPSPTPTDGSAFTFETIQNTPTCGSASIDWTITTPANVSTEFFDLFVGTFIPTSSPNMLHLANVNIYIPPWNTTGNSTSTWSYEWSPVNVTQGTYVIQAFLGDGAATSLPFNVTAGDTSCLISSRVSSVPPASQTPSPSPSPSPTSPAREALQSGHKVDAATVAAIILGTILLAVTATAIFFLCRRRRASSHGSRGEKGYEGRARRSFPGRNDSGEVVRFTPMPVDDIHDKSIHLTQDTVHRDVMVGRTIPIPPQPASNVTEHSIPHHNSKEGNVPSDMMTERSHRHRFEQRISSFLHLSDSANSSMISDSM